MINSLKILITSINIKGLNIRCRKTWLMSRQWEIDIVFNIWFTIVPQGLETQLFWGNPPLSEAFLKSYPPLSEIHPNWCMQIVRNTLKWRCYVSYYTKSIENIINITLFTFRLNSIYYWHFLWLNIAFNVFHIWYARGMNMKHF